MELTLKQEFDSFSDTGFLHKELEDIRGRKVSFDTLDTPFLHISMAITHFCPFCLMRFLELNKQADKMHEQGINTWLIFNDTNSSLKEKFEFLNRKIEINKNLHIIGAYGPTLRNYFNFDKSYLGRLKGFKKINSISKIKTFLSLADINLIKALYDWHTPGDLVFTKEGELIFSHQAKHATDRIITFDIMNIIEDHKKIWHD